MILDVSNNNPITEAQLREAKPQALICKATEGTTFKDPVYEQQRELAHKLGIPFGAYLFLHPGAVGDEADFFLNYAKPTNYDLQPIIDCEIRDGASFATVAARADACATRLESEGFHPLLYSYTSFLQSLYAERPQLERLRVWQAAYTSVRPVLGHGATVVMWQFSETYPVGGGHFDASRLFVPLSSLTVGSSV